MNDNLFQKIYTIGYSGFRDVNDFIAELKNYGINVLIDVRSSPYSAHFELYNKENLERTLKNAGIYYRNYAREFGARQEEHRFYTNGILDFRKFTASPQFAEGMEKVDKTLNAGYISVLMCAEKEPVTCHRTIMVSKKLKDELFGIEIIHILPGGKTKTMADIEQELLDIHFPDRNQESLFNDDAKDESELIAEAYVKQNWKIGFHEEDLRK